MRAAKFSKALVSYCSITQHHNPEDIDLNSFDVGYTLIHK